MALPLITPNLDDLPEAVRSLYKKREDGKFQLDVEGAVEKGKFEEFRTNNRELAARVTEFEDKLKVFEGIDPVKYKELIGKFQNDEEKKLLKDGDVDGVVKIRTAGILRDRDDQLAMKDKIIERVTAERDKATAEKNGYIVETELRKAVDNPERGFHPNVSNMILDKVLKEFIHKDGKVIRVKPDGTAVFGKDGEPMGMDEYVQGYAKEHPYLIKPSSGGGARKESGGPGSPNGKTMKRADFDALDAVAKHDFTIVKKGTIVD